MSIYFRFFRSAKRRAKSSKPGSSAPPCAGGGNGCSFADGIFGNGSWAGGLGATGKPRCGLFDGDWAGRGGWWGSDGAKLIFGYCGWG